MIRKVASIIIVIVALSSIEVALKTPNVLAGLGVSLVQLFIAYLIWPKPYNSLVQFGYSYDLLDDLAELDFLKSKLEDSPFFNIWVGDYVVIAYNDSITEDKFAVAQLKQFTKRQLKHLSPQTELKYHSADEKGIWFEIVTDEKLKRLKKKPYPFK